MRVHVHACLNPTDDNEYAGVPHTQRLTDSNQMSAMRRYRFLFSSLFLSTVHCSYLQATVLIYGPLFLSTAHCSYLQAKSSAPATQSHTTSEHTIPLKPKGVHWYSTSEHATPLKPKGVQWYSTSEVQAEVTEAVKVYNCTVQVKFSLGSQRP